MGFVSVKPIGSWMAQLLTNAIVFEQDKLQLYWENNVFILQWSWNSHFPSQREISLWKICRVLWILVCRLPVKYKSNIPYSEFRRIDFLIMSMVGFFFCWNLPWQIKEIIDILWIVMFHGTFITKSLLFKAALMVSWEKSLHFWSLMEIRNGKWLYIGIHTQGSKD